MKYLPLLVLLALVTACGSADFTHYRVKATCPSSRELMDSVKAILSDQEMRIVEDSAHGTLYAYSNIFWRGGMNIEFAWKIFRKSDKEIAYECRLKRSWTSTTGGRHGSIPIKSKNLQYVYLIDENVDEETEEYWKVRKFLMDRCTAFDVYVIDCDPELDIKYLPL